ncbi:MAG TPA: hypothetical protein ENK79_00445, partial [Campylobacterales bacterium]|nr:hypothetical protein [Campylobacterales bacterium]
MHKLFQEVHELFLATQFTGFMSQTKSRQSLYEYANIFFKHLTWLENDFIKRGENYTYSVNQVPIKVSKISDMYNNLIDRINSIESKLEKCKDTDITFRVLSDLIYIKASIQQLPEENVESSFDTNREYPNVKLTDEARDALTIFLFEETYKEYELIMIYNYSKANSSDAFLNRIFQILIDESFFHLRSFGQMMADMGILAVPRGLME